MARVTTPESFTASHHAAIEHTTAMIYIESATEPDPARVGMIWYDTVAGALKVCTAV